MGMQRKPVHKKSSAKQFGRKSSRTKAANVGPRPMRGGIRL